MPQLAKPVLAGFLLLLLAAELLWPGHSAQLSPPPVIQSPANARQADVNTGEWANTVLARPLFNADRRPVQPPSTITPTVLPRLSAIIVSGGTTKAIFASQGPLPEIVKQGGQIDGYDVVSILPDAVKLAGPDGHLTLRPQFGAGSSSATADTPPAVISANPAPPPPPVPTAASRLDDDPI